MTYSSPDCRLQWATVLIPYASVGSTIQSTDRKAPFGARLPCPERYYNPLSAHRPVSSSSYVALKSPLSSSPLRFQVLVSCDDLVVLFATLLESSILCGGTFDANF